MSLPQTAAAAEVQRRLERLSARAPDEIDLQYAVASALVGRAIRAQGTPEATMTYGNILKYASCFPQREMGVMLVSDMHRAIGNDLFEVEEFADWAESIADLIL